MVWSPPIQMSPSGLHECRISTRSRTVLGSFSLGTSLLLLMSLIPAAGSAGLSQANPNIIGQSQSQTKPKPDPQQDTSAQAQEAPVRLNSRLVLVPVSASDAAGRPVKDLKVEDIIIE